MNEYSVLRDGPDLNLRNRAIPSGPKVSTWNNPMVRAQGALGSGRHDRGVPGIIGLNLDGYKPFSLRRMLL